MADVLSDVAKQQFTSREGGGLFSFHKKIIDSAGISGLKFHNTSYLQSNYQYTEITNYLRND